MFGKRFHVITIAGFEIGIDLSWFFIAFLLTWTLASGYYPQSYPNLSSTTYWLMGFSGMVGLFIGVVLHELGHAFVARHYKIPITQITLFIFGGVAELKQEPKHPKDEFFVAIAGPIVSFLLAGVLYGVAILAYQWRWPMPVRGVVNYLALINFILGLFNLIPAFPLDGGRVLRALLWGWKKNLGWATRISSLIGSGFGFALIFLGIFNLLTSSFIAGFWLIILGWFLNRAATATQTQFYLSRQLEGETVSTFMKTPISIEPHLSIQDFVTHYVYTSHHHLYPVTQDQKLLGYVSLKEIKTLSHDDWKSTTVHQVMVDRSHFQAVSSKTNAMQALELLQNSEVPTLFIVDDDQLVGILTAQDLFKIISLKMELQDSDTSS